uniref:Uncharacterized protein n=1 Tax=Simulacricoccus ruber TaxID=2303410 RepID=A0A3S7UVI9_9BACT|nr:hypothetical protein [Simulacricoccus ruber]
MPRPLPLALALLLLLPAAAALARPAPPPEALQALNAERIRANTRAVWGLAGWTSLNLVGSTVGALTAEGRQGRAFHLANAGVSAFTLGAAGMGLLVLRAQEPARMGPHTSLRRGVLLERLLGVGIAMDLAALGAGAFLRERGTGRDVAWMRGAGTALLVQGSLLLLFDAALLLRNAGFNGQLMWMLHAPARGGVGVGLGGQF